MNSYLIIGIMGILIGLMLGLIIYSNFLSRKWKFGLGARTFIFNADLNTLHYLDGLIMDAKIIKITEK